MGWANAYSQGTRLKRRFGRRAPVGSPVLGALTKAGAGASTTGRNIEEKICVVPEATFSSRKGSFITRKPHGGALPTWLASGCVWVLPIQQGVATSGRPDNRGVLTGPVADGSPPPWRARRERDAETRPQGGQTTSLWGGHAAEVQRTVGYILLDGALESLGSRRDRKRWMSVPPTADRPWVVAGRWSLTCWAERMLPTYLPNLGSRENTIGPFRRSSSAHAYSCLQASPPPPQQASKPPTTDKR